MTSTDSPRVAVARAYLESLISHEPSAVRLTADAMRFENGERLGSSGPEILESLATGEQYKPLREIRDLRWHEWDSNVVARYLLDLETPEAVIATIRITEHFLIPDDAIAAITVVFEPFDGSGD
ncbi:hypothetical protein [Nocardia cyriacigeorgica]|uniref:DUF8021 domain-containing protein n=1 Tax=Nocardia cyriacigeorgica TaxID=135487 RepID=A0A6P1DAG6_9NOCA|nr:hypothetical protein [Nocardia cyriacigeorgica]NEW45703.1 hypothetical protein [Nocardia cyriacigeorgica]